MNVISLTYSHRNREFIRSFNLFVCFIFSDIQFCISSTFRELASKRDASSFLECADECMNTPSRVPYSSLDHVLFRSWKSRSVQRFSVNPNSIETKIGCQIKKRKKQCDLIYCLSKPQYLYSGELLTIINKYLLLLLLLFFSD